MSNLKLIKSAKFGETQCDIYSDGGNEPYMTIAQLAEALGYASKNGVEKMVQRNRYLSNPEFSSTDNLSVVEGNRNVVRETIVFTEDGIYEVTMLSKTEKAKEFRAWIRKVLKDLRSGKAKLVDMTEYQRMQIETRQANVKTRNALILERIANQYQGTFKQVLHSYATKELTGQYLLPLPKVEARTYTATEIGQEIGTTANMVGVLSNRHGLKTDEYGAWFNDKAKGHNKEVQSFRYYEKVIPVLRDILERKAI